MKLFERILILIVVVIAVAGFIVAGSPKEERLRQFDDRRVGSLQELQWNIVNYWQGKGTLPENLVSLRDDLRGITVPVDPETGEQYGYAVIGPESFSLCATFAYPSGSFDESLSKPRPMIQYSVEGINQNWEHKAGYVCFDRTIDKDFYKPIKTQ